MTTLWVTIVAVAIANVAIKAVGPVLVGAETCPRVSSRSSLCWRRRSLRRS
jgi:ABC-type enterobactin transport system permease subunit